jgi:hypothetical protein
MRDERRWAITKDDSLSVQGRWNEVVAWLMFDYEQQQLLVKECELEIADTGAIADNLRELFEAQSDLESLRGILNSLGYKR